MYNKKFMEIVIEKSKTIKKDIPIVALIEKEGKVLSICSNQKEKKNQTTAHAEILAIKKAEQILNNWRLNDCDLYVTLEPCPMCLWAIIQARIKNLYFGSYDTLMGGVSKFPEMTLIANSKLSIKGGIMEEECNTILNDYLKRLRD